MRLIFRSITTFFYIFYSFCFGLLLAILRPFNANTIYLIAKNMCARSLALLGVKVEYRGFKVPKEMYPVIFICNHQNNLDVLTAGACLKPKTVLVGKKSILWIPIFGPFFALSGNVLLDRKNPIAAKKSMVNLTKRIVENKLSVWILPEGTRSRGRGLLPFKKGAFITAINAGVPIIPIVFSSYTSGIDYSKKVSGCVLAKTLSPILTKNLTLDDVDSLVAKTHDLFKETIRELDHELSQVV